MRNGNPEQPHGPFAVNKPRKQSVEDGQHLLRLLESLLTAARPGHQLERTPAHFERQCPSSNNQFGQAMLHLLCKSLQDVSISCGVRISRSTVTSLPTDLRSRTGSTGRSSTPQA